MKRSSSPRDTLPPPKRPYDSYRATAPRASGSGSHQVTPASSSSRTRTAGRSVTAESDSVIERMEAIPQTGRREEDWEEDDLVGELSRREARYAPGRSFAWRSPSLSVVPDSQPPEPQQQHVRDGSSRNERSSYLSTGRDEDRKPDFSTYRERASSGSTAAGTAAKLLRFSPADTNEKPNIKELKPKIEDSITSTLASTATGSSTASEDDKKPLERYVVSSSSSRPVSSSHAFSSQQSRDRPFTTTEDGDNKPRLESSSSSSAFRDTRGHRFSHPSSTIHPSESVFALRPPEAELDDGRDRSRAPSPPEAILFRLEEERFATQLPAREPKKEEEDDDSELIDEELLQDDEEAIGDEEAEEYQVDMEPPPMLSVEELSEMAMDGVPMSEEETPVPQEDDEEGGRLDSVFEAADEGRDGDGDKDEDEAEHFDEEAEAEGSDEEQVPKRTTSATRKKLKEEKACKGFTTMGPSPKWKRSQKIKKPPEVESFGTPPPQPTYRPIGAKARLASLMGLSDPVAPSSRPAPNPLPRHPSRVIESPASASPPAERRRSPSVESELFPEIDPDAWPTVDDDERRVPARAEHLARTAREPSLDSLPDYDEGAMAESGYDFGGLFPAPSLPPQTRTEAIRSWFVRLLPNTDRVNIEDDFNYQVLVADVDFLRQRGIHHTPSYVLESGFFDRDGHCLLAERPGGGHEPTAKEMLELLWEQDLLGDEGTERRYLPRCEPERKRSWEEAVGEMRGEGLELNEVERIFDRFFSPYDLCKKEGALSAAFKLMVERNWVWFEHVLHLARIRRASFALAREQLVEALEAFHDDECSKLDHRRQDLEDQMRPLRLRKAGHLHQEISQISTFLLPRLEKSFEAIVARMKRRLEELQ